MLDLKYIAYAEKEEIAELIRWHIQQKQYDLDACIPDYKGQRFLHRTCISDGFEFLTQELLEAGASPHAADDRGETPLHCAALIRSEENAKKLLAYYADPNACNHDNRSPLHILCSRDEYHACYIPNRIATIKILLAANANPNSKDRLGETPFSHLLAASGSDKRYIEQRKILIKLLLAYGANPLLLNSNNITAIKCAQESTSFERHEFAEYAKHLLLHKPTYLRFLTCKTSILHAFPTDIIKLIIDAKFPELSSMANRKFYGTCCKVRKERIKMKLISLLLLLFFMCMPLTTKPMLSEMLKDFDDSKIPGYHFCFAQCLQI